MENTTQTFLKNIQFSVEKSACLAYKLLLIGIFFLFVELTKENVFRYVRIIMGQNFVINFAIFKIFEIAMHET